MGLIQNIVNLKQVFLFSIHMYVKRSSVAQTPRLDLRNIVGVLLNGNIYQLNTVVWANGCIYCRCACLFLLLWSVFLSFGGKTGFEEKRRQLHHSIKRKTKEQEKDRFFFLVSPHCWNHKTSSTKKTKYLYLCQTEENVSPGIMLLWHQIKCAKEREGGGKEKDMSAHWNGIYQQRLKSFCSFISMRLVLKNK